MKKNILFIVGAIFLAQGCAPGDEEWMTLKIKIVGRESKSFETLFPEFFSGPQFSLAGTVSGFQCLGLNVVGPGIPSNSFPGNLDLTVQNLIARNSYCSYSGIMAGPFSVSPGTKTIQLKVPSGHVRVAQMLGVDDPGNVVCSGTLPFGMSNGGSVNYFEIGRAVFPLFSSLSVDINNEYDALAGNANAQIARKANCEGGFRYFLFAPNQTSNNISVYTIDPSTGALKTNTNGPFTAGNRPYGGAVSPKGDFLYVPNFNANTVSAFAIDRFNGNLTEISGSPYATGTSPDTIVITPNGTFVYIANYASNTVSAFSVNTVTGTLSAVAGSPFVTGTTPNGIAVDSTGHYLYVSANASNAVKSYSINLTSGALTFIGAVSTGSTPNAVVTTSSGFVYSDTTGSSNIDGYSITSGTGALTALGGSPFAAGLAASYFMTTDPLGKFLYATVGGSTTVASFSINNATGGLAPVGSPVTVGTNPQGLCVDPQGKFMYIASGNNLFGYALDQTNGAPSPLSANSFAAGTAPVTCVIAKVPL